MEFDVKRKHDRQAVGVAVRFLRESVLVPARTRDLSLGGAFIETDRPLPLGARCNVEIDLPALAQPVVVEATVRWSTSDGMGVQWGTLRSREAWAINQLLKL